MDQAQNMGGGRVTLRRRDLIPLLGGGAITWPLVARAQQKAMPVIGFYSVGSASAYSPFVGALHQGLSEAGYVEGQNVAVDYRWADGHFDRLPQFAAEYVSRKVDLILASGGNVSARAAKDMTSTIPIVFVSGGDLVDDGIIVSLAHPGGNITGVSLVTTELQPKRLELLFEMIPKAKAVALLANPNSSRSNLSKNTVDQMQQTARAKTAAFHVLHASTESEIDAAFSGLSRQHIGGLIVGSDAFFFSRREQLVALAARYAVPTIYEWREYAILGGLISYGTSVADAYRLAGIYCGKILKGANPGELPVQQPTRFYLVLNLRTAKALGLTVPQSLLARADEVIE